MSSLAQPVTRSTMFVMKEKLRCGRGQRLAIPLLRSELPIMMAIITPCLDGCQLSSVCPLVAVKLPNLGSPGPVELNLGFLSLDCFHSLVCKRRMGNVRHYLPSFYVFPGADCIQGAKAQQKRDRKAQNAPKATKSQSKSNEMAKSITCLVCKQSFVSFFRISFSCSNSK